MSLIEQIHSKNQDFRCIRCKNHVSSDPILAGVNNRNHCPYCLHSRHVDWRKAGDRMAACKAEMRPVGLTLKLSPKKYASENSGELMLVHQCADCGKLSINRIAADDDYDRILEVYEASLQNGMQFQEEMREVQIRFLGPQDRQTIVCQLWGCDEILA
jgi:DNA-directed RNA polymerase subunit RPC12/RpoP